MKDICRKFVALLWEGDTKGEELISLFKKEVLPEIKGKALSVEQKRELSKLINEFEKKVQSGILKQESHLLSGICLDFLEQSQEAIKEFEAALDINPNFVEALLNLGRVQKELGRYQDAISTFGKGLAISENKQKCKFYNNRGNVFFDLGALEKARRDIQEAIKCTEGQNQGYITGLGNVLLAMATGEKDIVSTGSDFKLVNQAIEQFKLANKAFHATGNEEDYYWRADLMHAIALEAKGETKEAADRFVELEKKNSANHLVLVNIAIFFEKKEEFEKAIELYKKTIFIKKDYAFAHWRLGNVFFQKEELGEAIKEFKKFEKYSTNEFSKARGKAKISDLQARKANATYQEIAKKIDEIEGIMAFKEPFVTHYTKLETARHVVLNWSNFRASEASFMNDPSEGDELFKYFGEAYARPFGVEKKDDSGPHRRQFEKQPFIGSFVPARLENNLSMWRFYGKDEQAEANGCSISIDASRFQKSLVRHMFPAADESEANLRQEDFQLYKVGYFRTKGNLIELISLEGQGAELAKALADLKDLLRNADRWFKNKGNQTPKALLHRRILNLANLFKSDAYQHENEVRLILPSTGFKVKVDSSSATPGVYIELVPLDTCLKRITIGPKAHKKQEWNAALRYHLDNNSLEHVDVKISALPYR